MTPMKNSSIKKIRFALGFAVAIALPSCLENETTITLNKDGSGTIIEETVLATDMLAMMTQFSPPGTPDPFTDMFSDAKSKAKASKLGTGVEFVKTEMVRRGGKKGARVEYKFTDINNIEVNATDALEQLEEPGSGTPKQDQAVKFIYTGGELKITTPPTDFEGMPIPDTDAAEQDPQAEMMSGMIKDTQVTMKLVIADGIAETNATHREGDTITLIDVEVGKMLSQKSKLKAIAETAKTDVEAAELEFSKLRGVKVETQNEVTVKVK